jgi:hypothetical protein
MKMDSAAFQHAFVVEQLAAAFKKCEAKGISPEMTIQTVLSSGVTMLIAAQGPEGAATLLDSMADAIRHGEITATEH